MVFTKIKNIKTLREMCIENANTSKDDYSAGVANGVELALAIIEKREPNLICTLAEMNDDKSKYESEVKKSGRTVASGIIRKKS